MRFLHTADWQIGMKARHVGSAGERVRKERLTTIGKVLEAAKANRVEFVLVAGDTFEDNGVDRILVQTVADKLAAVGLPVFVIPGNHDPYVPGSVWEHPAWKSAGNVGVLLREEPVEVPGGVLYPCPVREKRSGKDPTAWIRALESQEVAVGVAHGTVEGIHQEEPEYPIPRNAANRSGLDYLSLGHWHSFATFPSAEGVVRMAYAGTHEPTGFGERNSGNALIVEIPGRGVPPQVNPVRTGSLEWVAVEEEVRETGDLPRLRERIETMSDPTRKLLDIRVRGLLAAGDHGEIARIQDLLGSRFLYGRLDTAQLRPSPADDDWLSSLPRGIIRDVGAALRELADPNWQGARPEGASPEVAARALRELSAIVSECSR